MHNLALRANIDKLEVELKKHPQVQIPVKHTFGKNIYMREIFLPAGLILTGKVHKYESMHIIQFGKMVVTTEEGQRMIEGPCTHHSMPGVKRAGIVIEDTLWITVHTIDNVNKMKEEDMADYLTTNTYEEYLLAMSPYGQIEENKVCLS